MSRVQNPGGQLQQLLNQKLAPGPLISEIYLWSLARNPRPEELKLGTEFISSYPADKQNEAAQDLMWALLNSKDFLLSH